MPDCIDHIDHIADIAIPNMHGARTLLSALRHHATTTPTRPAILFGKSGAWSQLTYADLSAEADRWAAIWLRRCRTPGSVVVIVLTHRLELYGAFLGAMRAGLVPTFLPYPTEKQDPGLYWSSHKALFARVQPACILTYTELAPALRAIRSTEDCEVLDVAIVASEPLDFRLPIPPDETDPDSTALLQHSSGTTGLKKGVVLTYSQIQRQISSYAAAISATRDDRIVSWLPVYHDMGLVTALLLPVTLGALIVSLDAFEWLTQPDRLFDTIERFAGTLCWLPNFAFNHLIRTRDRDRRYDLSTMRGFINCSEPCKAETIDTFKRTFADHGLCPSGVQTCYAMAETVFGVTQTDPNASPMVLTLDPAAFVQACEIVEVAPDHPNALQITSCGRPIDGLAIRIGHNPARPDAIVPSGREDIVGEVQIAGAFLFDGYHANPAATQAAFDGAWFRTGDIGFIHAGELFICGRIKEMLIVHGRNYYANDIEEIVNRVPGIKPGRVVAIGLYDKITASEEAVVIAETALTDDFSRQLLAEAVRKEVSSALSLSLRRVEIVEIGTLIKTTSGKLSREENAKRMGAGVFA